MILTPFTPGFFYSILLSLLILSPGCTAQQNEPAHDESADAGPETADLLYHNELILTGAERMHMYLPQIEHKSVGLVVNQTSAIHQSHLADTLIYLGIDVKRIFAPEHGFRGQADAGEYVKDGIDIKTGVPIVSLYGKNKKPSKEQIEGLEYILFDIQDVGARFYTYISTMHYVMEAAAESGIPVIVLDRPNPNGHYVAGPVLNPEFKSFVGMHPVPIVHGMTVGEYAMMINGQQWLAEGIQCDLTVVPCDGYDHNQFYELPIKPSPNLPNMHSIYLYPSLCLFEGTSMSVGRGTDKQFQVLGLPGFQLEEAAFHFTPVPMPGAKYPKHENVVCSGWDFSAEDVRILRQSMKAPAIYKQVFDHIDDPENFFTDFFDKLAGGNTLREAIQNGVDADSLNIIYNHGIEEFITIRKSYLLYPDFHE